MQDLLNEVQHLAELQANTTEGPWAYEMDEYDGAGIFVDEFGDGEKPNPCMMIASDIRQGISDGADDAQFICAVRDLDFTHLASQLSNYVSVMDTNRVLSERLLQAATPAPASDEVLAELEALHARAGAILWKVEVDVNDDCFIYDAAHDLVATMPWVNSDGSQQDADLIVALRNAAPALLARVRQAEAFRAQVLEVLNKRRDAAYADFTTYLEEDNDPNAPIPGAEAGDEINKIAAALGLTLDGTVKGGQQDA